jgi:chromosome segregation protein
MSALEGNINETDSTISIFRERIEQHRLLRQEAQSQSNQSTLDAQELEQRMQLIVLDTEEQVQSERSSEEQIRVETDRREQLATKETQLQLAIVNAETSRKQQENVKEQMKEQLVELKIQLAQSRQEHQSLNELVQRLKSELSVLQFEWSQNEEAMQDWQEQKRNNDEEINLKQHQLQSLREQKQLLSEQLAFTRAERVQASSTLEEEESLTRDQRIELRQVDEQLHQTDIKLTRCEVELDHLLKKLADDYELSFELAQKKYPVPDDVPITQQLVRDLKRQIHSLGDVNIGAIEEYERVSERFTFLTSQRDDLDAAKKTLYEVIKEINGEMGKRFLFTFEQIRSRFCGVFSSLFGGGRADLILSEPEHILTTGIEIVAQPPGKSLKNLQLLSGGERALTAIALLFSILHIKPVPFCVLDEVEAALDEANVSRFAQYLREFAQQTQFIVVTHRKGTMEEADVLYGVTMQDSGVSKLVSVKLEEQRGVI